MYVMLRAEGLLLVCGGRYKSLHFRTVVPECKGWQLGGRERKREGMAA